MDTQNHVYRLKVDSSGRLSLPTEVRDRHRIAGGDTIVVLDGTGGLRIQTLDEVISEAQVYFGKLAPHDVVLSDEILADRRSGRERD